MKTGNKVYVVWITYTDTKNKQAHIEGIYAKKETAQAAANEYNRLYDDVLLEVDEYRIRY